MGHHSEVLEGRKVVQPASAKGLCTKSDGKQQTTICVDYHPLKAIVDVRGKTNCRKSPPSAGTGRSFLPRRVAIPDRSPHPVGVLRSGRGSGSSEQGTFVVLKRPRLREKRVADTRKRRPRNTRWFARTSGQSAREIVGAREVNRLLLSIQSWKDM